MAALKTIVFTIIAGCLLIGVPPTSGRAVSQEFIPHGVLPGQIGAVVPSGESLAATVHQMGELEGVKLNSLSTFFTALFMLIALIPQGILHVIEEQVKTDFDMVESLVSRLEGNGQSDIISHIIENLHQLGSGGSGSSADGNESSAGPLIDLQAISRRFLGSDALSRLTRLFGGSQSGAMDPTLAVNTFYNLISQFSSHFGGGTMNFSKYFQMGK